MINSLRLNGNIEKKMERIKIWNNEASGRQLREISQRLENGEIGIIPTDTMYAIVGNALDSKAVERICRIKGINPDKTNLSIICSDISMASEYAKIDNTGFRLLKDNCPGPFTWLFRSVSKLPKAFKGRKTVGIRIPDLEFCRQLAATLGKPLITTSIQFSDEDYAVNPELIGENYEGTTDFIIEGETGLLSESTIVDCTTSEPEIIRQGAGNLE